MRVAVVIPAFNEEHLIARAIGDVPAFVDDVIVVDDASVDATYARACAMASPRLSIVRHEANRGVGAAIVTGYHAAFERGADIAAVMAGDAQMDPCDLPRLLHPIVEGKADYVKGDRLAHPLARSAMPAPRWIGNHVLSWLTRVAAGIPGMRDSQCGYTALSRLAGHRVNLDEVYPRYGYPNDLCARLHEGGARIAQIVVRPVYGAERSGITLCTALLRIPFLLVRIFARRLTRSWGGHPAARRDFA